MRLNARSGNVEALPMIKDMTLKYVFERITDPTIFGNINDITKNITKIYKYDVRHIMKRAWQIQSMFGGQKQCHYLM